MKLSLCGSLIVAYKNYRTNFALIFTSTTVVRAGENGLSLVFYFENQP